MLQKDVYTNEYIDNWEKFNENSLPEKEYFYSHLNMEDIANAEYADAIRFCKKFGIWYKELLRISWFVCSKQYITVQSDTLLLAEIYELHLLNLVALVFLLCQD